MDNVYIFGDTRILLLVVVISVFVVLAIMGNARTYILQQRFKNFFYSRHPQLFSKKSGGAQ